MKHPKKWIYLLLFVAVGLVAKAQQSPVAAGNEASGTGGTASYSVGQVASTSYSGSNYTVLQGVQQPYEITDVLPLQLLRFAGRLQNRQTLLTWTTASETNLHHFEIERKPQQGNNFTLLATVAATGNSSTQQNYQYTDALPFGGVTYYRLKAVNNNASSSFSQLVLVNLQQTATLQVFPNPVVTQMNILFSAPTTHTYQLVLVAANGQTVLRKQVHCQAGTNSIVWNVAQLAAGSYTLQANDTGAAPLPIIKSH